MQTPTCRDGPPDGSAPQSPRLADAPHPADAPRAAGVETGRLRAGVTLRIGQGGAGIERLEAGFNGPAFAPHRHDTYAIGITTRGVQSFRYRGARRLCLPGETHILHPDELHDGAAATDDGFGYRIVYIDPALVQQALGGRALPFVADPVVPAAGRDPALGQWLADLDVPIDEAARVDLAVTIAGLLDRHAGGPPRRPVPLALARMMAVREMIAADPAIRHPVAAFERVAGLDRWTIARQFRQAFGTSPSRFRTLRQIDIARRLITGGLPLAEAALEAGFADQSHMSRLFKGSVGLTPARWAAAQARPRPMGASSG
ncbi:AraC family transcriptional regulator [Tistrella bauzanensis]|uniref:AraC family transcriptional regulator n=1 Tax=Tistrella bauzanensis TaxID=657419 RepID=UPI00166F0A71|nr:AraC family transcriptional regulator [Tistrella bauzanensis]